MRSITKYLILFGVTLLLQTLLLDHLTISVYFAPMIYTAVLLLLPVSAPSVLNLFVGFGAGLVMDILCGTAGLHTIVTTATGYLRRPLLVAIVGHEGMRDVNAPSRKSIGSSQFFRYFILMVAIHDLLFYLFETLSAGHLLYTLLRFGAGTLSSLIFLLVTAHLFTVKTSERK